MPRSPPTELISSRTLKSSLRLKRFCLPVVRTLHSKFEDFTRTYTRTLPKIQGLLKTLRGGRIIAVGWCPAFCAGIHFLSDVSVAEIIRLIMRLRLLSSCVLRNGHHSCVDLGNGIFSRQPHFPRNISVHFSFLTGS